ncbi:MAG: hypothetical protein HKN47_02670, partial [Pirellulaceae bacterium]|nr:hypothetical protein [Pirellulaceae bacterium]
MRFLLAFALTSVMMLFAGVHGQEEQTLRDVEFFEQLEHAAIDKMRPATEELAKASGRTFNEVQNDMEFLSLFQSYYTKNITLSKRITISSPPSESIANVVGDYRRRALVSLAEIDRQIVADQKFLNQGRNNTDNESFVKTRVEELESLRQQVLADLDKHLERDGKTADDSFITHLLQATGQELQQNADLIRSRYSKYERALVAAEKSYQKNFDDFRDHRRRKQMRDSFTKVTGEIRKHANNFGNDSGTKGVMVIHSHKEICGGSGNMTPGQETLLHHREYIYIVTGDEKRLAVRLDRMKKSHQGRWIATSFTSPQIEKSSITVLMNASGLSS